MNMKRILSCLLLSASYLLSNAQGIVVYQTDGTQIKIPCEQIDSITFYQSGGGSVIPVDPSVQPVTVQDLTTSEWEDGGLGFSNDYTIFFSPNMMMMVKQGDDVIHQGSYTLEDNVVSFFMDGITYKSMPGLAGGQSVLIMKEVFEDGNENFAFLLVQKGKPVSTKKEDIQGQWVWWEEYLDNDSNPVKEARLSYKFEGDRFEMILVAWGQKYTGTYTYENGIVSLQMTNAYTSREEGTGEGWGPGDLDPVTLECDWKPLYREYWSFETMQGPFFVIGDEAFSGIMMPSICKRKK